MVNRKKLNYPPFTRLAALGIECEIESIGERATRELANRMKKIVGNTHGVEMVGPSPAALYQIKKKYRWHILLRAKKAGTLLAVLDQIVTLKEFKAPFKGKVKISIDVDPINIL